MSEQSNGRVALVTGANRGLGRGIAEQLGQRGMTVLVGARDLRRGEETAAALRSAGADAHALAVDVSDQASVDAAAVEIDRRFARLDVLVNNAGISGSGPVDPDKAYDQVPSTVDVDMVREVLDTNVLGVIRTTNAMLPLLRHSPAPRVVNISSHGASLTLTSDPAGPLSGLLPSAAYLPSKSALNALTVQYAKELLDHGILVNAVAPGFVDTDSNNHTGMIPAAEAARIVVHAATLDGGGPTGAFLAVEGTVPW